LIVVFAYFLPRHKKYAGCRIYCAEPVVVRDTRRYHEPERRPGFGRRNGRIQDEVRNRSEAVINPGTGKVSEVVCK